MLTLDSGFAAHIAGDVTKLTACWYITKKNGVVVRGTTHDADIVITTGDFAGTYRASTATMSSDIRSTSDGSVQNLEVEGMFVDAALPDLTIEEVEGGMYDQAEACLFLVNWAAPDSEQVVRCYGTLGEFYRDSLGRFRTEVRGLGQALKQTIIRTYSERCNVEEFGDSRCKLDAAALGRTGTVATVTNRKSFTVTLNAGPAPLSITFYNGGRWTFTSGSNSGVSREVATASLAGSTLTVVLWEEAPADIAVGVTVSVKPGCDRRFETCRDIFNNVVNFRGFGLYASGKDILMRGPT